MDSLATMSDASDLQLLMEAILTKAEYLMELPEYGIFRRHGLRIVLK